MRLFLIFFLGFLLASCTKPEPLYNTQSYVFGTLVDITIYGESEAKAQMLSNKIIRSFQSLHNRLHAWHPSELKTLNQAFSQGKTPVAIQPDVAAMITDATKLSIQSKGAFNPAIGGLIEAWGFHHDEFKPVKVDENKIRNLVQSNPKMSDIIIQNGKVFSNNPSVQVDLGGYAKGYALDMALAYLQKQGVKNALINIGGNIIALGKHGDNPWRVGIQHPRKPNAIATLNLNSGWAIGTSGDYQRYFELDGKRYCHVIDPATGYPVQGVESVTVLIPSQSNAGTLSDVASKPIFIAKPEAHAETAKTMGVENFLVIESADKILVSKAMSKRITWLDKEAAKHAVQIQPSS
ncbi:MAG: FAD:protein FMN transferase [Methylotenera sp.]